VITHIDQKVKRLNPAMGNLILVLKRKGRILYFKFYYDIGRNGNEEPRNCSWAIGRGDCWPEGWWMPQDSPRIDKKQVTWLRTQWEKRLSRVHYNMLFVRCLSIHLLPMNYSTFVLRQ